MKRVKKLLIGTSALLLVMGLALALMVTWLASEPGSQWLLRQLPASVSIDHSRGSLRDNLRLSGIRLEQPGGRVTVGHLALDWEPWALLGGTLHIRDLSLSHLRVEFNDSGAAATDRAITLPSVALPLRVRIDRLHLQQLTRVDNGGETVLLEQAEFSGSGLLNRLEIKRLVLHHPHGQLRLGGRINLRSDYPLQLDSQWQAPLADAGMIRGRGTLSGSLRALRVQQRLDGALNGTVNLSVNALDPALPWQGSLAGSQLDPSPWLAQTAGQRFDINASAQGNLDELSATLAVTSAHPRVGEVVLEARAKLTPQRLEVERATLSLPAARRRISLSGQVDGIDRQAHFSLAGDWQALGYPLEAPDHLSPSGNYRINGTLDSYQANVTGTIAAGQHHPAATMTLTAEGSVDGFRTVSARIESSEGNLSYRGRFHWGDQINWDGSLEGDALNPRWLDPAWPGALSLRLSSTGSPSEFSLSLEELRGQLRAQPVSATGELSYRHQQWSVADAELRVAESSRLELSGSIGEQLDLQWRLEATPPPGWIPTLAGSLSATGKVRGATVQPRIQADVKGRSIRYQQFAAQALDGRVLLDLNRQAPSVVELRISRPAHQDRHWRDARLHAKGTLADHDINLNLAGQPASLDGQVSGSWDGQQWLGDLRRLTISQPELGRWQLAGTSRLQVDQAWLSAQRTCLSQQPARVCVDGDWRYSGSGSARLTVTSFEIAPHLARLFPNATEGQLEGNGELIIDEGRLTGLTATASVAGARIELEPALWLEIDTFEAQIDGDQRQLSLSLDALIQELGGKLSIRAKVDEPLAHPDLQGHVQVRFDDLQLVSLIEPSIQAPSGILSGDLRLAGNPLHPTISGHLALNEGAFDLPATGIRVERLALQLDDDPKHGDRLLIRGNARSGDGELQLAGELDSAARTLNLQLTGESFLAVSTPEATISVSPQITLRLDPEQLQLRGSVTVPSASLTPPELRGKVTASSDVQFVSPDSTSREARFKYDTELRLILGEDVRFEGFGLKSRLEGNLVISDDGVRGTRASGSIQVASGRYRLYGQDLDIDRGRFVFSGGPIDNPGLDMRISRQVEEVTVGARISGTLKQSDLSLYSTPAMPDPERLSYLILGRPPGSSDTDEQALALRAAMAVGLSGTKKLGERLTGALPVDELGLESDDTDNTSFYIGKYLSPSLYVRYGVGLIEPTTTFFIRYKLSDKWDFESQTGTYSSGADLIYTIER